MNIRDLKYLVAIADLGHFGKAADTCFVSQPALSMQIKKLEETLGVQLIERGNKNVFLTAVGKLITEQARDILYRIDLIKALANQAKDPFSGELHLGVIPTLAPYLLPYIMPTLVNAFPKLKIYLVEEQTNNLEAKLKDGKLDGALFGLPLLKEDDFVATPLFAEELLLAAHHNHVLAKQESIHHTDLKNQVMLLLEDGHCLREQVLTLCETVNASPDKSFQATSLETLRHMVASTLGITLIPRLALKQNDGISYLSFNCKKPMRTIGMIWRSSSAKKILLQAIASEIKTVMAKLNLVTMIDPPVSTKAKLRKSAAR